MDEWENVRRVFTSLLGTVSRIVSCACLSGEEGKLTGWTNECLTQEEQEKGEQLTDIEDKDQNTISSAYFLLFNNKNTGVCNIC